MENEIKSAILKYFQEQNKYYDEKIKELEEELREKIEVSLEEYLSDEFKRLWNIKVIDESWEMKCDEEECTCSGHTLLHKGCECSFSKRKK